MARSSSIPFKESLIGSLLENILDDLSSIYLYIDGSIFLLVFIIGGPRHQERDGTSIASSCYWAN